MDLDGNGGKQFRVLNCDGDIAEVINIDSNISTRFGDNNTYNGSDLDVALNTTYYNTLSAEAKAAIVPKDITQYQYTGNSSSVTAELYWGNADYSTKSVKEKIGNRYIYALDIEDIFEKYLGSKGTSWSNGGTGTEEIKTLLNVTSTGLWLRSANENQLYAYYINGSGFIEGGRYAEHLITVTNDADAYARPAFQIDLSKINYTRE